MSKPQRILITNNHLKRIGGSEVVVLELTEAFLKRGWNVDVFAPELGPPMDQEFLKLAHAGRLRLIDDVEFPFEGPYDLIWIHHHAIPSTVIDGLAGGRHARTPVVWMHMSALESLYMEQPLLAHLEEEIADVVAVVSEETQQWVGRFGMDKQSLLLFDNPAPDAFADTPVIVDPGCLKKVLCVSTHPPDEVLELRELLAQSGCRCDLLGQGEVSRLTPERLKQYDAVITIGKTVQYALSMGLPCYIYDRFGGDGWLTEANFQDNAAYNFSGRNRRRKMEATQMREELLGRFAEGCRFAQANRARHADYYRLSRRIDALLSLPEIERPKKKHLDDGERMQLRQYAAFVRETHSTLIRMREQLCRQKARLARLENSLQKEKTKKVKLRTDMASFIQKWNKRSWLKRAFYRLQLPEKWG